MRTIKIGDKLIDKYLVIWEVKEIKEYSFWHFVVKDIKLWNDDIGFGVWDRGKGLRRLTN